MYHTEYTAYISNRISVWTFTGVIQLKGIDQELID